jgi:hypothetical protein
MRPGGRGPYPSEVDQNGTGMHEVKGSPLQFVVNDVVTTHFEIRKVERFQKAQVDIGRHDASV